MVMEKILGAFLGVACCGVAFGQAVTKEELVMVPVRMESLKMPADGRVEVVMGPVKNALYWLKQLSVRQFKFTEEYQGKNPQVDDRVYFNVAGETYAKIFPAFVSEPEVPGPTVRVMEGFPLVAFSVAAIQELDGAGEQRDKEIKSLQLENKNLEQDLYGLQCEIEALRKELTKLQEVKAQVQQLQQDLKSLSLQVSQLK